jgi:hypothetical protein
MQINKQLTASAMTPDLLGLDYYVKENARLVSLISRDVDLIRDMTIALGGKVYLGESDFVFHQHTKAVSAAKEILEQHNNRGKPAPPSRVTSYD